MAVVRLDHVNITSPVCDATKDFFVDVVGLTVGDRPPFAFGGYWLYAGDLPVVHLNDALSFGQKPPGADRGGAAVDHISFRMTGFHAMRENLRRRGVPHRINAVPRAGDMQIFVDDPNGVTVEMTFPAAETTAEEKAQYGPVRAATP